MSSEQISYYAASDLELGEYSQQQGANGAFQQPIHVRMKEYARDKMQQNRGKQYSTNSLKRFRALFLRAGTEYRRQYCVNVIQIFIPLVIILALSIANLVNVMLSGLGGIGGGGGQRGYYFMENDFTRTMTQRIANDCCSQYNYSAPVQTCSLTDDSYAFVIGADVSAQQRADIGALPVVGPKSGLLGQIPQYDYSSYYDYYTRGEGICVPSPYFAQFESQEAMQQHIDKKWRGGKDYCRSWTRWYQCYNQNYTVPSAALVINKYDAENLKFSLDIGSGYRKVSMIYNADTPALAARLLQYRFVQALLSRLNFYLGQVSVTYFSDSMNYFINMQSIIDAMTVLLFPLSVSFSFPIFMSQNIEEKSLGLDKYMKLFGVKVWEMEFVRFLYQVFGYGILFVGAVFFGGVFQFKFFTAGRPERYLLLFALWGFTQIGMASLLSKFIERPRRALFVGFITMFIFMIIGGLLNILVFDTSLPPWYSLIIPPFAFIRGFATIMLGYSAAAEFTKPQDFWICLAYLAVETLIMLIIGSDTVFELLRMLNPVPRVWSAILSCLKRSADQQDKHKLLGNHSDRIDQDVLDEIARVQSGNVSPNAVLVLRGLTKIFQTQFNKTKVAVNDLTLSVRDGECFGLLGENGAGKSTTISMICGQLSSTSGEVLVGGESRKSRVQALVGVCPQFDIFFPRLTVREHLLFYARLRGVPITEESKYVDNMIAEVGLEEARRRYALKLSGGMKRRLSIAISMCGNPLVCILDEPSSGLDAASRRAVWDIIQRARKTRSIIVSSHHLDEIEALCNRVSIISSGKLVALGTLAQLKAKYGEGYKLMVSATIDNQARAHAFVMELLPQATHESSYAGLSIYRIRSEHVKLSNLFSSMNKNASRVGIRDWSVQVASLEEIFIKLSGEKDD